MDFSIRNKKVAENRWKKVHDSEMALFRSDSQALLRKASICGFLAGDGNVQFRTKGNHYEIRFFPDDYSMVEEYIQSIQFIYNKSLKFKVKKNFFWVAFTSKSIYLDLINTTRFGLYTWLPPMTILTNSKAKINWLKAFFSAECYVASDHIKVQTVNPVGMELVSNLLTDVKIGHSTYFYKPKNPNYSLVSIIVINKKQDLKLFQKTIGFWHSKKNETLEKGLTL